MPYKRVVISEYGGPDVLKVVEEATLPEPQAGEVRVKVLAAGASATDTMVRTGNYPGLKDKPPFSPGYDMVGVVDKLGPGVTQPAVGQRVADLTVVGSYSEYMCLSADRLVPVPDGLDSADALTLVLNHVTAYQMLHRIAQVKKGQRILVHGAAGAVGTAFLQLGKLLDLEMYGTAAQSGHDFVRSMGATPIDYRSEDFVARTLELTGDGVDAAFDPISVDNFKRSFKTLRDGGRLVTFGFYSLTVGTDKPQMGKVMMEVMRFQFYRLRWNYFSGNKKAIYFNVNDNRKKNPTWFKEDLAAIYDYAVQGKLQPVIWKRMPLEEAAEAHRLIEAGKPQGKIVLVTDPAQAD